MPWFVAEVHIAQRALDRMARWSLTLTLIPTTLGLGERRKGPALLLKSFATRRSGRFARGRLVLGIREVTKRNWTYALCKPMHGPLRIDSICLLSTAVRLLDKFPAHLVSSTGGAFQ
jgi:hypothetical protein